MKIDHEYIWGEAYDQTFQKLKACFTLAPILRWPI
jgi:hypothetical protein